MTHPHGLTRQDVAHLKAEESAHIRFRDEWGDEFTMTGTLRAVGGAFLSLGGRVVRLVDGSPTKLIVEVISPKPPTPPMAEPTWLGAVVMTDEGSHVHVYDHDGRGALTWSWGEHTVEWEALTHPRPLTDAERRNLGIPETVPDGWVCVDAHSIQGNVLELWSAQGEYSSYEDSALAMVARAELARRDATA